MTHRAFYLSFYIVYFRLLLSWEKNLQAFYHILSQNIFLLIETKHHVLFCKQYGPMLSWQNSTSQRADSWPFHPLLLFFLQITWKRQKCRVNICSRNTLGTCLSQVCFSPQTCVSISPGISQPRFHSSILEVLVQVAAEAPRADSGHEHS